MRDQFPEYYQPTTSDFAALWAEALFVVDANVLLDVYRFSPATTDQLFSVLQELNERIWVPHQAALEYHKNRHAVSATALDAYDKSAAKLDAVFKELQDALYKNADSESFLKGVRKSFDSAKRKLSEARGRHSKLVPADKLDDRLAKLLEGKVGQPYVAQDLLGKQKLAESRLKDQIPPGFKDSSKPGNDKFGDVIVWFQLLDHAKNEKKPVILVSGDQKDDWWWRERGKTIGPRPELRREALETAGVDFYMYSTERFLESAREYLGSEISDEAIAEARDVQSQPDKTAGTSGYQDALRNLGLGTTAQSAYESAIRNINLASGSTTAYQDAMRHLGLSTTAQSAYDNEMRRARPSRELGETNLAPPAESSSEPSTDSRETVRRGLEDVPEETADPGATPHGDPKTSNER